MGMTLPYGALPILKARQQGKRPADLILASTVGPLPNEFNPVVIADKDIPYDWSWAKGLSVCFWTEPARYIARHIVDCAGAAPSKIYVWDRANEKGYDITILPSLESVGRPRAQWTMEIEALRWTPFQEAQFAKGELQCN